MSEEHHAKRHARAQHAAEPSRTRLRRWLPGWFAVPAGLVLLAVAVVAGWWLLTPDTPVLVVDDVVASPGPGDDVLAAADGSFAGLCLAAGVLVGALLLVLGREHLLRWSVTSLVGGALAALVAWQLGRLLGPAPLAAQQEAGLTELQAPLDLSTPLVVLLWPGATACTLFVGLLGWLLLRPPRFD